MSKEKNKNECLDCDCYDEDGGCTMPSIDLSYACSQIQKSILQELKSECSFKEVFDYIEEKTGYPKRKIGHMRADYDGYRWYNSVFPCHNELCTPEIAREIDDVYEQLIADDAFRTLAELRKYCYAHPECAANNDRQDEYNFYLEGEHCLFWIRCITRAKDYNLYLHAFLKEQKGESHEQN